MTPVDRLGPNREQLERLAHHRAGGHVASHDDRVHGLAIELGQYRTQHGQVSVDVGEHRDPHRRHTRPRGPSRTRKP